jgi:hypothetical protein
MEQGAICLKMNSFTNRVEDGTGSGEEPLSLLRPSSRPKQINKLPPEIYTEEREQVSTSNSKLFYPKICHCVGTYVCVIRVKFLYGC